MSTFQENLKKYRERLGISAKDFAAQIGVKYSTFSNYENQGREPKYDTLIKIAAALHVSIDDLLGYEANLDDKTDFWNGVQRLLKMFDVNGLHWGKYKFDDRDLEELRFLLMTLHIRANSMANKGMGK